MGVKTEPDFSGYATKAGIKCSDGRTIMPEAFKGQDGVKVPLVWQHGHDDPENVLGHAILKARKDGIWADCYFNDTAKAKHAHSLVEHEDINMMSIWANDIIERAKMVMHGVIREVSLVLSGANPGALIQNVTIRHSDESEDVLDDQAIIYTGLEFGHADDGSGDGGTGGDGGEGDETVQDIVDTMSEKQQQVLHYMIGEALAAGNSAEHGNIRVKIGDDKTRKGTPVKHNVFEDDKDTKDKGKKPSVVLSHSDMQGIVADATKSGSLKAAVENYALSHGIENIDILFPEARTLENTPQFVKRQTEWVQKVIGGARKSPFSRIKTRTANITFEEARAKGYIKGNLKKEEFFSVSQRETHPQTIYKKQALDRDDMIDITDFDVVAWLKGEMRLMLDEELARAILVGDGRAIDDEDKIREDRIRPIAKDDPFYTITVNVNLNDAESTYTEVIDAIIRNRQYYKGSGNPTMFTTETFLANLLLIRDSLGRRIYRSLDELTTELRVSEIVTVEILDDEPDILCILVNMNDYVIGSDKGGEVNLFDDFDIDYNKFKYLIETRCSGHLERVRSAMVFRGTAVGDVAVDADSPAFDRDTYTVTIPVEANVEYRDADTGDVLADDADIVLVPGQTLNVQAYAANGFYLTNVKSRWSYLRPSGN